MTVYGQRFMRQPVLLCWRSQHCEFCGAGVIHRRLCQTGWLNEMRVVLSAEQFHIAFATASSLFRAI